MIITTEIVFTVSIKLQICQKSYLKKLICMHSQMRFLVIDFIFSRSKTFLHFSDSAIWKSIFSSIEIIQKQKSNFWRPGPFTHICGISRLLNRCDVTHILNESDYNISQLNTIVSHIIVAYT